jgi:Ca2+-binding EF-hand superfamily protein
MKVGLLPLVLIVTTTAFAGQPPAESHKVMYLSDSGIIVLQMSILLEGQGPQARFEKSVEALLLSLDKNNDGDVTTEEAQGKILTAREARQMQLAAADGNVVDTSPDISPKDGKITRTELLSYFKRIGVFPFVVKFQSRTANVDPNANGMANQSGEVPLFQKLDANEDKKLSVEELANALEVLRKLDRDNDETISVAELQPLAAQPRPVARPGMNNPPPANNPFVSVSSGESLPKLIRRIVDKYDSTDTAKSGVPSQSAKNQKLSPLELGMAETEFVKYDVDGDGQLDFTELRQLVSELETSVELMLNLTTGKVEGVEASANKIRTTADGGAHLQIGAAQVSVSAVSPPQKTDPERSIKPLFMAVDSDANGYLEKSEAPDNALFGATFNDLDADKNGKLYLEEIVGYLQPRMEIARHRVELSIVEQGRTLFDILDSDRDGRLAHREVRSVADKLALWDADGDGMLSEAEIPLQFQLVAATGSLPNLSFQPQVAMNSPGGPATRTAGPVWFRKMDRNSDGEISRREFLGDLDLFEKLDLNHDGAIELNEAALIRVER